MQIQAPDVNVSSNIKWNHRIAEIVKKARKRLFYLTWLEHSGLGSIEEVPVLSYLRLPYYWICLLSFSWQSTRRPFRKLAAVQNRPCISFFHVFLMKEHLLRQVLPPCQANVSRTFYKGKTVCLGVYFPQKIPNVTTSGSHTSSLRFSRLRGLRF